MVATGSRQHWPRCFCCSHWNCRPRDDCRSSLYIFQRQFRSKPKLQLQRHLCHRGADRLVLTLKFKLATVFFWISKQIKERKSRTLVESRTFVMNWQFLCLSLEQRDARASHYHYPSLRFSGVTNSTGGTIHMASLCLFTASTKIDCQQQTFEWRPRLLFSIETNCLTCNHL